MVSPCRRVAAVAIVLALLAAACGGDDSAPASTSSTDAVASSSTTATTTATVVTGPPTSRGLPEPVVVEPASAAPGGLTVLAGEPPYRGVLGAVGTDQQVVQPVALPPAALAPGTAPLTGLPWPDPESDERRPAVLVKVDNSSRGRPQASLAQADLVYEEMIEGGATRLAAVFHTAAPELGPVRSGRTTDIALLGSLGRPAFAWSGANRVHAALLRRQDVIDVGAQTRGEYTRASDRPSPYDLMTDASTLQGVAAGLDPLPPPPHFEYRDVSVGLPASAVPAERLTVRYPLVGVEWTWSGDRWERTQGGTPHVDADGARVAAANVIVAEVPEVATGSVDTAGSSVIEQVFLGQGTAWVFTDGHVVEATWTKPSIRSVATWTTPDGVPVALVPGVTWVELVPAGALTVG